MLKKVMSVIIALIIIKIIMDKNLKYRGVYDKIRVWS